MIIEGISGLFPLTKIDGRMAGYYMNAQGHLYSTRKSKTPTRLLGTYTSGIHYFTLASDRGRQRVKRSDELIAQAKLHTDWAKETGQSPVITKIKDRTDIDRPLVATGIEKKGYIIGQVQGEAIVFGSKPKIHLTLDSVKTEVERLAQKSPGVQIIYLQIQGGAVAKGIHWV